MEIKTFRFLDMVPDPHVWRHVCVRKRRDGPDPDLQRQEIDKLVLECWNAEALTRCKYGGLRDVDTNALRRPRPLLAKRRAKIACFRIGQFWARRPRWLVP